MEEKKVHIILDSNINLIEILDSLGVFDFLRSAGQVLLITDTIGGIIKKRIYNKHDFNDGLLREYQLHIKNITDDTFNLIIAQAEPGKFDYLPEYKRDEKTIEYVKRLHCGEELFSAFKYCFLNRNNNEGKRFFYVFGEKNTGKTTYLNNTLHQLFFDIDMSSEEGLSQSYTHDMCLIEETTQSMSTQTVKQIKALTGNAKRINSNSKYGSCQTVVNKTKLGIDSNFLVRMKYSDTEYMTDRAIIFKGNDVTQGSKLEIPDGNTLYSIMMDCNKTKEELDEFCKDLKMQGCLENNTVLRGYREDGHNGNNLTSEQLYVKYKTGCTDNSECALIKSNFISEFKKGKDQ